MKQALKEAEPQLKTVCDTVDCNTIAKNALDKVGVPSLADQIVRDATPAVHKAIRPYVPLVIVVLVVLLLGSMASLFLAGKSLLAK